MKLKMHLPSASAEQLISAFEKKDPELQKRLPEFPILKIRKTVTGISVVLAAICLGILIGIVYLFAYPAFTRPTVNLAIANLLPLDFTTRSGDEEEVVRLADDQPLVLILDLPTKTSSANAFSAEIISWPESAGSRPWFVQDLRKQEDRYVTLKLPPDYLPFGRYRLRLFEGDSRNQPFSEYAIRLVLSPSVE